MKIAGRHGPCVQGEEGDINKEERGRVGTDIGNGKDDRGDLLLLANIQQVSLDNYQNF